MSTRPPHHPSRSPQLTDLNTAPFHTSSTLQRPLSAQRGASAHLSIKQRPLEERPRERLINLGPGQLSPEELLAVVLNTGRGRDSDVYALACELLREFQGVAKLSEASLSALCEVKGVGPVKGSRLVAAFELARRAKVALDDTSCDAQGAQELSASHAPLAPPLTRLERLAAQAYELIEHTGTPQELSLIAYPVSSGLNTPERLVTLSIGAELSTIGALSEREASVLSGACLRRLLSAPTELSQEGCEPEPTPWGLLSVLPHVAHLNEREREELKGVAELGLERLSASASLLGVLFEEAILIGEGAWVSLRERAERHVESHADRADRADQPAKEGER